MRHSNDCYDEPVAFLNLTTLDLGMVSVDPATLVKVLTRFELKSFNLWRVVLSVETRSDIKADPSPATKFMAKLANSNATKHVHRAMLGYLKVNRKGDSRHRAYAVDFPPMNSTSNKKVDGGVWKKPEHQTVDFRLGGSGSDFAAWAKDLADRAAVVKENRVMVISDDSNHEGDSEIDESEEDDEEDDDEGDDEDDE